jgi:hypothetical protein
MIAPTSELPSVALRLSDYPIWQVKVGGAEMMAYISLVTERLRRKRYPLVLTF